MSFEIIGILIQRGNTETKGEAFRVRDFAIKTVEGNYEQFVKFQCVQDRTAIVDGLKKGDEIKVFFDIRGRMYGDDEKIYTNLNAWKVEKVGEIQPEAKPAARPVAKPAAQAEPAGDKFDDLPF